MQNEPNAKKRKTAGSEGLAEKADAEVAGVQADLPLEEMSVEEEAHAHEQTTTGHPADDTSADSGRFPHPSEESSRLSAVVQDTVMTAGDDWRPVQASQYLVCEAFSPPRVTACARGQGHSGG